LTLLEKHAGPTIVAQENKAAITLLTELGHLPLAIKLAGQWLAKFSHKYRTVVIARLIKAIRQRGVESLEVPGQIGLRATFDLTYEDLSPDLQRLFQGLGIFATGTVSLRHVAGLLRLGVTETELKLDELVNVALLDWDEAADEDVVGYTIHPLLQQYARLLLEKSGEWPAMQQTYLNYYATFAETHNQNTPEAHNRLEKALADLSQAGRWAVDFAQPQGSNTLALALSEQSQFLLVRGHYHLALELLTWAIQASQELGDGPAEAIHCKNIGKVYDSLGRYNEAKKYYLQSLAYFQSDQADKLQLCEIRYYLASLHVIEQEYERATALIEQNLAIITQIPEKAAQQRIEAQTFYVLSNVAIRQQNLTKAKTLVEQSLALYDTLQDTQGQIGAYYNLGIILAQQGKDTAQARSFFQKCLSFWHEQGDITFQIYTLLQLVMLERAQENYSLVLDYLEQAERLCQKINDVALQVTVKRQRGLTHLASQDEEAACQEWQTALVLADDHLRQSLLSLIAEHCSG
jgi:tetratricopeptide (TPR) repeat protein